MKNHFMLVMIASSSLWLSGCATTDMQAKLGEVKGSFNNLLTKTPTARVNEGQSKTSLTKTKLMGILNQYPSTDGRAPEWPKIAITNLVIPAEQATAYRGSLATNDCIVFDAVLWHDARSSEKFTGVSLCAPELPKRSNDFVTTWRTFPISGDISGQIRSDGPTPPYSKLPNDAVMDRWVTVGPGIYFIGSMLTMMGYDPQFSSDNRRFWVRNVQHG